MFMESLSSFVPLFVAIISFCALFTALGLLFSILLRPIKKDIARLEANQKKLEANQNKLEANQNKLEANQNKLEANQNKLFDELKGIKQDLKLLHEIALSLKKNQ